MFCDRNHKNKIPQYFDVSDEHAFQITQTCPLQRKDSCVMVIIDEQAIVKGESGMKSMMMWTNPC